jgi:hypothetical protein
MVKCALKGQKTYSPGHRPGWKNANKYRPVRAEDFDYQRFCPFRAKTTLEHTTPRAMPWAIFSLPFQGEIIGIR